MTRQREFPDWEKRYREEEVEGMPWYHPDLDRDFDRAIEALNIAPGRVLDLGTGPGTQAIAMAKRGFDVTATDVSETAVEKARLRAKSEGVEVEFLQDDILESRLEKTFDLILDRGCFHVLEPTDRGRYIETVHRLLAEGGLLFLKCFSRLEPGEEGPYRFSPAEIRRLFESSFDVLSVSDSVFQGNREPSPKALFSTMRRRRMRPR